MDSLEEAQRLMTLVQGRVNGQELLGGETVIQMLALHTALAQAQQAAALVVEARRQTEMLQRIADAVAPQQ